MDFTEKQIMPRKGIDEKPTEVLVEIVSFLEIKNQNCFGFEDHYILPLSFRNTLVNLLNIKRATGR